MVFCKMFCFNIDVYSVVLSKFPVRLNYLNGFCMSVTTPSSFVDPSGHYAMPTSEGAKFNMRYHVQLQVDYQRSPEGIAERNRIHAIDRKVMGAMAALLATPALVAGGALAV
jgi:hypothetical protein